MPNEIRISYEEVYTKTAELRGRIQSELQEVETAYRQANTALMRLDSRTNAVLVQAAESNRQKCQVTCGTLTKLLSFIDASARQIERNDAMIARVFMSSRLSPRMPSNTTWRPPRPVLYADA